MSKHTRHHGNPNTVGKDPDIDRDTVSFLEKDAAATKGIAALITRKQGILLYPLLLLEGFNLHVDSARTVFGRGRRPRRLLEIGLLAVHWAVVVAVTTSAMSPGKAAVCVAAELACFGVLLGGAFAPNHTGMPILEPGVRMDFLHRQVTSSRNVRGGWWVDLLMGGLNHQVEHHLFPSMPRPTLRRVRPIVREFCRTHDIPYTETSFPGAYAAVVRHLNSVGLAGRRNRTCPLAATLRT
jgi:fatty acid desaturase